MSDEATENSRGTKAAGTPGQASDEALGQEAIRVYRRYQTEIVEALHLCPWAERSRIDGRTRERVVTSPAADLSETLAAITELAADGRVEVGFVILPLLDLTRIEFERFVAEVVRADAKRWPGVVAPFAMAAFHPVAEADMVAAERLVPFTRRSPDPTIQLVRMDALDRVREGYTEGTQLFDMAAFTARNVTAADTLPLRERIARSNLRTVQRMGVEEMERRFLQIGRDRDEAYSRLGFPQGKRCPSS